jgi:hypothetical protein
MCALSLMLDLTRVAEPADTHPMLTHRAAFDLRAAPQEYP